MSPLVTSLCDALSGNNRSDIHEIPILPLPGRRLQSNLPRGGTARLLLTFLSQGSLRVGIVFVA
jgi:hypothetical protein